MLRTLAERIEDAPTPPDTPVILIADELSPSDTARLDPALALGICTAAGGPTSHTAIIARSLGIPAVVGAGDSVLDLADGTPCVLDGNSGTLVLVPTTADQANARQAQADLATQREAERRACYQPAITTDGARVEVVANIAAPEEAAKAVEAGGEGVGLLRTEFLFLGRDQAPTEDEQAAAYGEMVRALNGLPIIIRTLDIGGDKAVPYLSMPAEENPFLGERGIRLCLNRPELFRTQLRAIFRAAATGPVRIMYPMISTLEELKRAKALTEEVRLELGADPVEIGIMIEVPSAVMMADGAGRRGRLLLRRLQRPDPILPGGGPDAPAAVAPGRRPAPGGAAHDRPHRARRRQGRHLGRGLRRHRRRPARGGHPDRAGRQGAVGQHPEHRRGQGPDPRLQPGPGPRPGHTRPGLRQRRRRPAAALMETAAMPNSQPRSNASSP